MAKRLKRSSRPGDGKAAVAFVAGASGLLLLTAAYIWLLGSGRPPPAAEAVGGAFSLTQDDGRVVTEGDFRGHYVLIYFGYTRCGDVCPMTLSAIADALDILGSQAKVLQPIFITVDPKHDSATVARAYASKFSPDIIGLSGTPDQIAAVERAYKVSAMTQATSGTDDTMSHTTALFLVGPDGRYVAPFSGMVGGPELARLLARYLPPNTAHDAVKAL